ncbi:DUF4097 family beta strand repeat-containing protein [Nonomuraea sp. NPDC047897]|uniref:DUF4097 family beta strand repeat-containing protein n=1 Tax=Nonomuraea sp. NPDC047897 TaxID=3364346 RepID=UPI0037136ACB
MRRMTTAATAAAMAGLVAVTSACGVELDPEEVRGTRTFPHAGAQVTITSAMGGLRVMPGAAGEVRVDRWLRGKAARDDNASWSFDRGGLRLSADCTIVFGDCGARYHVRVPPGVRVVVRGAEDGVVVRDLAQDVEVTSPGPIRVYGTTGRLRLAGGDSLIAGDRLRSADVEARTTTGTINLSFATPPDRLEMRSGDGRVTATVPDGPYRVTATSTDGRKRSQLKSTPSERTIVATTGTGDIRLLTAKG